MPPSDRRKIIGKSGEDSAAQFLVTKGYEIIGRNVRPLPGLARGEIDIIAWDASILCFIEVKARSSMRGPDPDISVSPAKRTQLMMLAEAYLSANQLEPEQCRFDVVSVWTDPSLPTPMVTVHQNAYEAS
jgi:putative endonuclease